MSTIPVKKQYNKKPKVQEIEQLASEVIQPASSTEFTTDFNTRIKVKKWTDAERKVIIQYVKKFPDNISEALRQVARVLPERTVEAVSYQYYSVIKKGTQQIISVGSSNGFSRNNTKIRHNKSDDQETPLSPKLSSFHRVMRDMMELNQEEIDLLINVLKHM